MANLTQQDEQLLREHNVAMVVGANLPDAECCCPPAEDVGWMREHFPGTRFEVLLRDDAFKQWLGGGVQLGGTLQERLRRLCSPSTTWEEALVIERANLRMYEAAGAAAEAEQCLKNIANWERARADREARDRTITSFDAARVARILDDLAENAEDAGRRDVIDEARSSLLHWRMEADPRIAEWLAALKELEAVAAKHKSVFERAARAFREIHVVEAGDVAHCRNPSPERLAHRDATKAIADALSGGFRERRERLQPTRKGRPALDRLVRIEAILTGKLHEKLTGTRPAGGLTFEEVGNLALDGAGTAEAADRVRMRVTRHLENIEPVDSELLRALQSMSSEQK